MKDFLFVYRADYSNMPQTTPEERQAETKKWMDWIGGIAAQGKLTAAGAPLTGVGRVIKPNNVVTDGPYMEIKEAIGGYSIVKAASIEEAAELSKGCPILASGGNVEIREIAAM